MADAEKTEKPPQVIDTDLVSPDEHHKDVAGDLFELSLRYDPNQLAKDARKVRKKFDCIALPLASFPGLCAQWMTLMLLKMMTTYMLSFLDKQTLVTAVA